MKVKRLHVSLFVLLIPLTAQLYHGTLFDVGIGLSIDEEGAHHKNVHQNMSITQADSFNISDLDWTRRASCGAEKCFFHSKSDNQIGYLLAPSSEKRSSRFQALDGAWELAERLRRVYGIQHFLLAPPTNITVTERLDFRLNRNLWSESSRKAISVSTKHAKRYPKGSTIVVQKVERAPKQNIILGCKDSKLNIIDSTIDAFARHVKYKESFTLRFQQNLAEVRQLLLKEPCLIHDFQVFVDTRGRIYHLDFDRCFNFITGEKKMVRREWMVESGCYKTLGMIERRVYEALKSSQRI